MSVFAIADLHLSFHQPKPMDIFGAHWSGHADKIRVRWNEVVSPDDTVLIVGDISWAMRFEEAREDLEWIAALPGTKVMVRGNHDYWWSSDRSAAKLRSLLPPSIIPLHKTSHVVEQDGRRIGIVGSRGWVLPAATPEDEKIAASEEQRLRASIRSLPAVDQVIGMIHIPPFTNELEDTVFVEIFREAGASVVLYGHVHRGKGRFLEGRRGGILFRNVACDQVGFTPQKIV